MAPHKPSTGDPATAAQLPKANTGAGVAKRQYKKVRFLENGLLDVERKTGKFLKIARQNQRDSSLLRLPPEIRNQIYGYALGGKTFQIDYIMVGHDAKPANVTKCRNALALLAVCRQIYAETALLPFALNKFSFTNHHTVEVWFKITRPAYVKSITFIEIKVMVWKLRSGQMLYCLRNGYILIWQSNWEMASWSYKELESVRRIKVRILDLDESAQSVSIFLIELGKVKETFREKLQSQNPGVEIVIAQRTNKMFLTDHGYIVAN